MAQASWTTKGRSVFSSLREASSPHVLHGDEGSTRHVDAHVEDLHDVRMANRCGGSRFALEAREGDGIGSEVCVQHLDRHRAADGDVLGLVDAAHATVPEEALDAVLVADRAARKVGCLSLEAARARVGGLRHRLRGYRLSVGRPRCAPRTTQFASPADRYAPPHGPSILPSPPPMVVVARVRREHGVGLLQPAHRASGA